ncbi:MerR family transcriptional regulator [Streptomyces sp. Y2F8-2]|uniref:MerR family transcriptional regulator n=1 Tax=Streptomyces sp. Y2F8-2 TaxID=2759675 RepID=UPI0027E4D8D0|nr:MerR family transcriptional regulator [Streptomyces sp. Y2F8-2]
MTSDRGRAIADRLGRHDPRRWGERFPVGERPPLITCWAPPPAFLRALGEHGLISPLRPEGGHRRYSRHQLRIAARARELVDRGTPIEVACRIVILEDQLEESGPGTRSRLNDGEPD